MSKFVQIKTKVKNALPTSLVAIYALCLLYLRKKNAIKECRNLKVNPKPTSPQMIVSLTSYGSRVTTTAPYAIATLLDQTVMPDRIILWLAYGTPVPKIYRRLIESGLEIKYCDDIRSYKKLVPALKLYPKDVLITADDDVFYPRNWFEQFQSAYDEDPRRIYVNRAHLICFNEHNDIRRYKDWIFGVTQEADAKRLFPTGVCGILYPPGSLDSTCTNESLFNILAPHGDDIWFWAMAKLKGTEYALIENGFLHPESIDPSDKGLYWDKNHEEGNDEQIKQVVEAFPEIMNEIT